MTILNEPITVKVIGLLWPNQNDTDFLCEDTEGNKYRLDLIISLPDESLYKNNRQALIGKTIRIPWRSEFLSIAYDIEVEPTE